MRVDLEEPVVARHPLGIEHDLVQREPLGHAVEEGPVAALALEERELGLLSPDCLLYLVREFSELGLRLHRGKQRLVLSRNGVALKPGKFRTK